MADVSVSATTVVRILSVCILAHCWLSVLCECVALDLSPKILFQHVQ